MTESIDTRIARQAAETASAFLSYAIREIDDQLGEGYAKNHPELVAAFMAAASSDSRTYAFVNHFADGLREIADAISRLRGVE